MNGYLNNTVCSDEIKIAVFEIYLRIKKKKLVCIDTLKLVRHYQIHMIKILHYTYYTIVHRSIVLGFVNIKKKKKRLLDYCLRSQQLIF